MMLHNSNQHTTKRHPARLLWLLAVLACGCTPDDPKPEPDVPLDGSNRYAYVLNEGLEGNNLASISLVDVTNHRVAQADCFRSANGRPLGDVGQDLERYGSRLYCVVFGSNTLEVIDTATGQSVKQIDMGQRGPRHLAFADGKVYVSCYDKTVVRLDTAALTIEATCPLGGMQPEEMAVAGDRLYVCNSWQRGSNGAIERDSTVSIVSLATFSETKRVTVGLNPGRIRALGDGRLLVTYAGDYGATPGGMALIGPDDEVRRIDSVNVGNLDVCGDNIYYYTTTYDASWQATTRFYRRNTSTLQATPLLEAYASELTNAYAIRFDASTGQLYVCLSSTTGNGSLLCFAPEGTKLWSTEVGNLPSKVIFR
ncbi:MAG: hypothetical protein IJ684_05890 [Bacteroidales bacterium]|nr:hypothetical protein [Bacteroidales bacterium]